MSYSRSSQMTDEGSEAVKVREAEAAIIKLRQEVELKQANERAKKKTTDQLSALLKSWGMKVPVVPENEIVQQKIPLYAIVWKLLHVDPTDAKLRALCCDQKAMIYLHHTLASNDLNATTPGAPLALSVDLMTFLSHVINYLVQARPAALLDFLLQQQQFFHALLFYCSDWNSSPPPADKIVFKFHMLLEFDMENARAATNKIIDSVTAFLSNYIQLREQFPVVKIHATSLLVLAHRSLLRDSSGRPFNDPAAGLRDEVFFPKSLPDAALIMNLHELMVNHPASSCVVLPYFAALVKVDILRMASSLPSSVAEVIFNCLNKKSCDAILTQAPEAIAKELCEGNQRYSVLHGGFTDIRLHYAELWANLFSCIKASPSTRLEPVAHVLQIFVKKIHDNGTPSSVRNRYASAVGSLLLQPSWEAHIPSLALAPFQIEQQGDRKNTPLFEAKLLASYFSKWASGRGQESQSFTESPPGKTASPERPPSPTAHAAPTGLSKLEQLQSETLKKELQVKTLENASSRKVDELERKVADLEEEGRKKKEEEEARAKRKAEVERKIKKLEAEVKRKAEEKKEQEQKNAEREAEIARKAEEDRREEQKKNAEREAEIARNAERDAEVQRKTEENRKEEGQKPETPEATGKKSADPLKPEGSTEEANEKSVPGSQEIQDQRTLEPDAEIREQVKEEKTPEVAHANRLQAEETKLLEEKSLRDAEELRLTQRRMQEDEERLRRTYASDDAQNRNPMPMEVVQRRFDYDDAMDES